MLGGGLPCRVASIDLLSTANSPKQQEDRANCREGRGSGHRYFAWDRVTKCGVAVRWIGIESASREEQRERSETRKQCDCNPHQILQDPW